MNLSKDVAKIIEVTLARMDVKDFAWVKLVKGTFAAETGLQELYDDDGECYGFMMMHRDFFLDTVRNSIAPNKRLQENLKKVTGVDISGADMATLLWHLKTNLAFQAAICCYAYQANYLLSPNDNLKELAGYYAHYWLDSPDDTAAQARFMAAYESVYNA